MVFPEKFCTLGIWGWGGALELLHKTSLLRTYMKKNLESSLGSTDYHERAIMEKLLSYF